MSKKYWEARSAQRETESQLIASKYLARMDQRLRETQQDILQQIETFYIRYAAENQVTLAEARKYLTAVELKDFKNVNLEGFKNMALSGNPEYERILNATSYRVRISRLEALNLDIEMKMAELYGGANGLQEYTYSGLKEVYQNGYYKTSFDLAKKGALAGSFSKLSDSAIKDALTYNWSGKEFSKRIWGHQEETFKAIRRELERSFASGRSIQKTTKAIMDITDVSRSRVEALVRTESNFFHNLAAQQSYKDANIDQYEILATLDNRTSPICRKQDGKIYDEKDFEPGKTAPPFHVRCRSTTIPFFNESEYTDGEKRHSADGLIESMTYEAWHEKYVKGNPTSEAAEKMVQNRFSDKQQYKKYSKEFGQDAPRSFAAFQELKYNDSNKYSELKALYRKKTRKEYLQDQFTYIFNGEKLFVPQSSEFQNVKVIAGKDGEKPLRIKEKLADLYGGDSESWQKKVGKIESGKYIFDLHWYELDGKQYEMKLKHRGERK